MKYLDESDYSFDSEDVLNAVLAQPQPVYGWQTSASGVEIELEPVSNRAVKVQIAEQQVTTHDATQLAAFFTKLAERLEA